MAKKASKETSIPLICSLVFFVLTTIAFGVMWYMQFSDQQAKTDEVAKAKKEVTAATGEAADAKLEAALLRVAIGIPEDKDQETIDSATSLKDKVNAKVKKFNDAVIKSVNVDDYSKLPDDLKTWPLDDKGAATPATNVKGILPVVGDSVTKRNNALDEAAKERANYKKAVEDITKDKETLKGAIKTFMDVATAMPKDFKEKLEAIVKNFDERTQKYVKNESDFRASNEKLAEEKGDSDRKLKTSVQNNKNQQEQLIALNKELESKRDKFQYEEPLGKVTGRNQDVVEINIGSDALVRPGLTFMVLPADYPEKGRQSRMREFRVRNEKGEYQKVERFLEKGSLEVIEVLGPNLARCRITSESEPIRDAIGRGNLIYNVAWRKGMADHIALIGIFDINGDGTDDMENVVRELLKMGIPVDAYFDLRTRTWKGNIDTKTRYIIRGSSPTATGANDPRRDEKVKIYNAMEDAIKAAQLKGGALALDYRDFFPRMGYKVRMDVNPERVNQAATPYMQGVISSDAPPMP